MTAMNRIPSGYKQTEVGVIPENWDVPRLGDVFKFKNGLNKGKEFFGHGTPIVNYMDVYSKPGLLFCEIKGSVEVTKMELKAFDVRKGDAFFTRTSETVEEVGLSSVMLDEPANTVFSGFILRARPQDSSLDDLYKKYCFSSHAIRSQITSTSTYTTRALTNGRVLSAITIPRPPLPEQRAIAIALSDVDALLTAQDKLIAKKRDIKQAAMQQLLTGKQRLPGFSSEWEVKRLGDVADIDSDNLDSDTPSDFTFNYISLEDVDIGSLRNYSEQVFSSAPSRARRRLKAGDILVSTVRPNLQSHLLFTSMQPNWVCSTGFSVVRCKIQDAVSGYVFSHIFANGVTKQIEALLTGSNYPAINGGDVRKLEIPLPSIEEQAAIAAVLSDMDADIAALEQQRDKTRALKQGMMQELLTGRIRLV